MRVRIDDEQRSEALAEALRHQDYLLRELGAGLLEVQPLNSVSYATTEPNWRPRSSAGDRRTPVPPSRSSSNPGGAGSIRFDADPDPRTLTRAAHLGALCRLSNKERQT